MLNTINFKDKRELVKDEFYRNDPTLVEIFRKSLPPKEAYYYFPKGEEVIILNKKKPEKSLRRIHINVPFDEREKNLLKKFKEIIKSHPENKIPDFWNDGLNLSYIYSTECDLEKGYKRMINYFKWYYETFPLNIQPEDKSIKLLNTGFIYIYGRDHQFRPIIICQPYILQKCLKDYSETEVINASIFISQYMVHYMLIPGQIENWTIFANLEKTSIFRIPDPVKKLMTTLSEYFIARLYKSYVLGLNGFLRILFKIMCNFLEEVTVRKFVILESKKDPNLFQDFNPENLEERFGGKAENCIYEEGNCLFPPRMPSNYYFKENEDPNDILITEEEYINKYNSGNIPQESVSPFVIERLKREKLMKEKKELAKKKREEAIIKRNKAKTKAELNINTSWNSYKESFDLKKFKTSSKEVLNGFKSFSNMKKKFFNNLVILNDNSSDNNINFEN